VSVTDPYGCILGFLDRQGALPTAYKVHSSRIILAMPDCLKRKIEKEEKLHSACGWNWNLTGVKGL
jgi:hypothetical protein